MKRRTFITLLGGAAAAWPQPVSAQPSTMPLIGVMRSSSGDDSRTIMVPLTEGLRETGYVVGQNVAIEFRAEPNYDRLSAVAVDLVRKRVAVIVATGAVSTPLAAKAATATIPIPIVFIIGSDPVEHGLVASLNRPGKNITGITIYSTTLIPKRVELLRELVPQAKALGFLTNPNNPNSQSEVNGMQRLAHAGGWELHVVKVETDADLDRAFSSFAGLGVSGLLTSSDVFFATRHVRLAELAVDYKLPAIFTRRDAAVAGGLMSYGARVDEMYRAAGVLTGRVLRGEKPADLPVLQPVRYELVINLKTAKALGLEMSAMLLALADEVTE